MLEVTEFLKVKQSAHILYLFEDKQIYLANLMAYIRTGIERNHHLILIERSDILSDLEIWVGQTFSDEERKQIHQFDNFNFYGRHGDFHSPSIVEHFGNLLSPFLESEIEVRTWAHVEWKDQEEITRKIAEHECVADQSVAGMGLMSVCAYAATEVPASLQTNMMRSHEYLMTDKELVKSTLYRSS